MCLNPLRNPLVKKFVIISLLKASSLIYPHFLNLLHGRYFYPRFLYFCSTLPLLRCNTIFGFMQGFLSFFVRFLSPILSSELISSIFIWIPAFLLSLCKMLSQGLMNSISPCLTCFFILFLFENHWSFLM